MSPRRTYDHRIREAIVASGDPNLFPELNIPTSTARTWLKEGSRAVVGFSDSLIEAWRRSLKHQWLYLHQLDSIGTVRRLVGFYVQQHIEVMPHSAFNGLTPDEVFFGRTTGVLFAPAEQRVTARTERLKANQAATCPACPRAHPWSRRKERQPSGRIQVNEAARRFAL